MLPSAGRATKRPATNSALRAATVKGVTTHFLAASEAIVEAGETVAGGEPSGKRGKRRNGKRGERQCGEWSRNCSAGSVASDGGGSSSASGTVESPSLPAARVKMGERSARPLLSSCERGRLAVVWRGRKTISNGPSGNVRGPDSRRLRKADRPPGKRDGKSRATEVPIADDGLVPSRRAVDETQPAGRKLPAQKVDPAFRSIALGGGGGGWPCERVRKPTGEPAEVSGAQMPSPYAPVVTIAIGRPRGGVEHVE
ncbi:unnamed protein product [Lampetra fluviatilis]